VVAGLDEKEERRYWKHIIDDNNVHPLPTGFGSLSDWLPVGRDEDSTYGPGLVLVCCNTRSPNHGHVGITTSNLRGRRAYFDLGIDNATFTAESEALMASSDTGTLSSQCVYVCDLCERVIRYENGPWLQAMTGRRTCGSVDICNDCQPTEIMKMQFCFLSFPPGAMWVRQATIVRLWVDYRDMEVPL
jgi:hypothetical protein